MICWMPDALLTPICMTSIHLEPDGANTNQSPSSRCST